MLDVLIKDKYGVREFDLILNGKNLTSPKSLGGIQVSEFEQKVHVESTNLEINSEIKKLTTKEISDIAELNLLWNQLEYFHLYIRIQFLNSEKIDSVLIFEFYPTLAKWNRKYSFSEYKEKFDRNLFTYENSNQFLFHSNEGNFATLFIRISTAHKFSDQPLIDELAKYEKNLVQCHEQTLTELEKQFRENSISASFNFPEPVKVHCEQYLLYFATFLRDLGINATSNLGEEAGKVLFSVTPTDDMEALDKIREALAVYLNLPASPIVYDEIFAAMELQREIENLRYSQRIKELELRSNQYTLRLAERTIENQDKIILYQSSLLEQQNKLIEKITSKSIMMDSLENKEEYEEIYDGIKSYENEFLKKYTGIGLNAAKAIKTAVKNTFGKDEKKSVLGLDEEIDKDNN